MKTGKKEEKEMSFIKGFPNGSDGKELTCNAGDMGSILWMGRPHGEGNGYPLHCSCLENPLDRGAWWATIQRIANSQRKTEQLSIYI